MRRTKIICTIGPASNDISIITKLIRAGMNVARINFSHGTHEEHLRQIRSIRQAASDLGVPVAILQDLCGPKIRTGDINGEIELVVGGRIVLTAREDADPKRGEVGITYPCLPGDVKPGDTIMLADGEMELRVLESTGSDIVCEVIVGGTLGSGKGINVPGVSLNVPSVTEKDIRDLDFGLDNGVDWIAVSFVRSAQDIVSVRERIRRRGFDTPVIAKIEKHEALDNIDAILVESDGVMVARGDLGVEIDLSDVPAAQKMIIRRANTLGKPVITATQMLQSMIDQPRPTRAEVSDIANAIFDGTDAVMLSGETAIGRYPVAAVRIMADVALKAEEAMDYAERLESIRMSEDPDVPDAIGHAASYIALDIHAKCIICCTRSGQTARLVSKYRPDIPIIAVTPNETTMRRLALIWGVVPVMIPNVSNTDALIEAAKEAARQTGLVAKGDRAVIVAGLPTDAPGTTNAIKADLL